MSYLTAAERTTRGLASARRLGGAVVEVGHCASVKGGAFFALFRYLAELYDEQRFAARDLAGWPAAAWTARRQLRHWKSLMYHKTQQGLMDTLWHMQTSGEYTDDP